MSRYFREAQESVDQAVHGVYSAVGRLKDVAKQYPSLLNRDDCEPLYEAADELAELMAKLQDRKDAA